MWNSVLKCFPDARSVEGEAREFQRHASTARIGHWGAGMVLNQAILNRLIGPANFSDDEDGGDEEPFA